MEARSIGIFANGHRLVIGVSSGTGSNSDALVRIVMAIISDGNGFIVKTA